jgi:hypothetical protein
VNRLAYSTTAIISIYSRVISNVAPLRYPITGIAGCYARAASGHAKAAPPSVAKNFRRPM